jgi:hypothetical protein
MIDQGGKRRVVAVLGTGLAVAAVAGIAIAGTAVARRSSSHDTAAAGGGPATPSALQTPVATPTPPATPARTAPAPVVATPSPATAPKSVVSSAGRKPVVPQRPQPQQPPADPVAACKSWLKDSGQPDPSSSAKVVARLDGTPGTVLILADSNYWVGCDTAFARTGGGQGSLRQPARIGIPPLTADTFAVANNLIPIGGQQYDYFWAAGRLPQGITKVTYVFPDDTTTDAVIKGSYWVMQHQNKVPWHEGAAPTTQVIVRLFNARGLVTSFDLQWGKQTCAQITHGC